MPRRRDPRREEAYTLWEDGLTPISEIADNLGVSASQVHNWKKQDGWLEQPKPKKNKVKNRLVKNENKHKMNSELAKRISRSNAKNDRYIPSKFEELYFKDLTDEERSLLGSSLDKYKTVQALIERYTIQEIRIINQIEELEVMPTGAKSRGEDVNMVADTVKVSKGTHIGQNENLIEITSVAKEKRLMELWNQLTRVQNMKAQALKAKHRMEVDDARYGLTMNEGVEMAKDNARMVLEALMGKATERGFIE